MKPDPMHQTHAAVPACSFERSVVRRSRLVAAVACAAALAGCEDAARLQQLEREVSAHQSQIREHESVEARLRTQVAELTRVTSTLEAERAPLVQSFRQVREGSPVISTCVLQQVELRGVLVAVLGDDETQRTLAGASATICILARLHDDYDGVAASLDRLTRSLDDIARRLKEPEASLRETEAQLRKLEADDARPTHRAALARLESERACEAQLPCRLKRTLQRLTS